MKLKLKHLAYNDCSLLWDILNLGLYFAAGMKNKQIKLSIKLE